MRRRRKQVLVDGKLLEVWPLVNGGGSLLLSVPVSWKYALDINEPWVVVDLTDPGVMVVRPMTPDEVRSVGWEDSSEKSE